MAGVGLTTKISKIASIYTSKEYLAYNYVKLLLCFVKCFIYLMADIHELKTA